MDTPALLDAGSDGGMPDAGPDAPDDAGVLTGVTCVVVQRAPGCAPGTPTTYSDVPFELRPVGLPPDGLAGISSPLAAFRTFYNTTDTPLFVGDAEGRQYTVGAEGPNIARRGLRIDVDIHVSRAGTLCPGGEPLIRIDCTGSTLLTTPDGCRSLYPLDRIPTDPIPPALSCAVRRRNASCATVPVTNEVPTARVAPGWHGSESELWLSSPALVEAVGTEMRFYQEHPCSSYAIEVSAGTDPILRRGSEIWIESLVRSGGSCLDSLGNAHPTVEVTCSGAGTLSSTP